MKNKILTSFFVFIAAVIGGCADKTRYVPPAPTATAITITSRVASVTAYTPAGAYTGIENYYYNGTGILISHTVKNSAGAETERFTYEYDGFGKIAKLSYYVNAGLESYSLLTYGASDKVSSFTDYDAFGSPINEFTLSYDASGYLARVDANSRNSIPSVYVSYFLFTNNQWGLFTQEERRWPSGGMITSVTQDFDTNHVLRSRHLYSSAGVLSGMVNFDVNSSGLKTDVWVFNAASVLSAHGVYLYEPGIPNIDENLADFAVNKNSPQIIRIE